MDAVYTPSTPKFLFLRRRLSSAFESASIAKLFKFSCFGAADADSNSEGLLAEFSNFGVDGVYLKRSRSQDEKYLNVKQLVEEASAFIGPVWPLKNGIACNPLLGMQHKKFWGAIEEFQSLFHASNPLTGINEATVNRHFIKWIQAFLDEGQATWHMPERELGFYRCWLRLAPYDRLLIRSDADQRTLALFPQDPEQAIAFGLKKLGIQQKDKVKYVASQLAQLSGWAGYVKWQTDWRRNPSPYPIDLIQFLAVRIVIACILKNQMPANQIEEELSRQARWTQKEIEAYENEYRNEWVAKWCSEARQKTFAFRKKNPLGQLVFCIDVRSESFRKQLEAQGNWETFGFAGFFGIPISLKKNDSAETDASCPVLLKPQHEVLEISQVSILSKAMSGIRSRLLRFYKGLKYQFGTPFALAETIGPWSGLWMALKSLNPQIARTFQNLHEENRKHRFCCLEESISLKEQVQYAQSALAMIGLKQDFAPIVVFCGHKSTVQNNPHAASLNCGACGGNSGAPNARLIASILNSHEVRSELAKQGIQIPEETLFLGAEHDTATDDVRLFCDATKSIQKLKEDLKRAQAANAASRMALMGSPKGKKEAIQKSIDWSETRPEWGLAKNAAFLVGPRTLSENLDLTSRCFLHSYDWRDDSDGAYLETILTAPMVVAQWINAQYFFSAFSPVLFGSGSKITHNVVGKIGVMQGNGSDLMHGLPLQSIDSKDREPYHIPMRLMTAVFAPKSRIDAIVKKHPILQNLFFNHWVKLIAIDPTDLKPYELQEGGGWVEIPG